MLRVALVGCGKVADQHVQAIHRIPDCEIVALCDRELLMAKQLGERFGISECFSDLTEMLRVTAPDVVHITTPPQSHFSLARQCLEVGKPRLSGKTFRDYGQGREFTDSTGDQLRSKNYCGAQLSVHSRDA